jgi:hypothetical protein
MGEASKPHDPPIPKTLAQAPGWKSEVIEQHRGWRGAFQASEAVAGEQEAAAIFRS